MEHTIHSVKSFHIVAPYTLEIFFEDHHSKIINFLPLLKGEMYGLLQDPKIFSQARVDPEVKTIVWPNGADFDPALLYAWDQHVEELTKRAKQWAVN